MVHPTFELSVATYNIRLGIQQGLRAVADVLLDQGALDIVAVQEVGDHWVMGPTGDTTQALADLVDLPHAYFVPTIEKDESSHRPARYGHALLARWPISNADIIALPRNEDEPRALLHASIAHPDETLEVLSTHLSHLDSDRLGQGEFLKQFVEDHGKPRGPRFLAGDLNATPRETWLSDVLDRWHDADAKRQRPTFPADAPQSRIDYVLAQQAELVEVAIPANEEASDHRPVMSRWRISQASPA